jgi:hypothetical protein
MTAFGPASVLGVHPDLIRTRTKLVEANKRYYLYEGSAYRITATLVPATSKSNLFAAKLFSTEDPDRDDADIDLEALDVDNPITLDHAPAYYHRGLYIETTGTSSDTAYITLQYITRSDYAAAFPATECKLVKAWEAFECARGAFLENYDQGQPEQEPWANDGTTTATSTVGEYPDDVFRITDDGDATKKIAFQASGISTSTVRTITMPDADVDLSAASMAAAYSSVNPIPADVTMEAGTSTSEAAMSPAAVAASADFRVAQALVAPVNFSFTVSAGSYSTELPVPCVRALVDCTIEEAYLVPTGATSGSTGAKYWTSEIKNATQANVLSSAPWTSNGDELAVTTAKDLNIDQNQDVNAGDIITATVKSVGSPTNLIHSTWTWFIKAVPR